MIMIIKLYIIVLHLICYIVLYIFYFVLKAQRSQLSACIGWPPPFTGRTLPGTKRKRHAPMGRCTCALNVNIRIMDLTRGRVHSYHHRNHIYIYIYIYIVHKVSPQIGYSLQTLQWLEPQRIAPQIPTSRCMCSSVHGWFRQRIKRVPSAAERSPGDVAANKNKFRSPLCRCFSCRCCLL